MQIRAGSWTSIFAIYAFGLISSAGFGKLVPLIPAIKAGFGVTSATAGLAMSMLAIIGALGALMAGTAINRIGDREALGYAAFLSIVANLGAWWAPSIETLLLFRALDGITCITYAVAGPMLLMRTTSGARRTMALTIWATSISIGFQLGVLSAATVARGDHWRDVFLGTVALQALALLLSRCFPARGAVEQRETLRESLSVLGAREPMQLGLAFAVLSLMRAGTNTIIPLYFLSTFGLPMAFTALFSSLSTLPDTAGSFSAGFLLNKGFPASLVGIIGAAILVCGGTVFMAPMNGWETALGGMLVFQFANGWLAALLVTMLPQVRGRHSASSTSGIFNQLSFVGLIFAAPLALATLDRFGWIGIVGFVGIAGAAIVILMPVKGRFGRPETAGEERAHA
jgi:predicted MFS family arabinose efflux permease